MSIRVEFLTLIREYLKYGVNGLAASKEVFEFPFAEKLAGIIVEEVRKSYWRIYDLIYILEKNANDSLCFAV